MLFFSTDLNYDNFSLFVVVLLLVAPAYYNYCNLVSQFLDKYLVLSSKCLVQANRLRSCRQMDSDLVHVGELTQIL